MIGAVAVVAAVWLVVLLKAPAMWAGRADPQRRFFWCSIFLLAACFGADRGYQWLGRVTGIANIGLPVLYSAGVLAAYCGQRFLLEAQPGPVRMRWWRSGLLVLALGALWGCYLVGPLLRPDDYRLTGPPAPDWPTVGMYLVVAVQVGVALVEVGRRCWTLARLARRPGLRWGLRLATVGAAMVVTRLVVEYLVFAPAVMLFPWPWIRSCAGVVSEFRTVGMLGGAVLAIGFSLPSLSRHAGAWFRWARAWVQLQQLRRLRKRLDEVAPSLPRLRSGLSVEGVEAALYRTVIEISDARLELRGYGCAADGGPQTPAGDAVRTAVGWRVALVRRGQGRAALPCPGWRPEDRSYAEEVAHLIRVSKAWRRAGVVRSRDLEPGCVSCRALPGPEFARSAP